MMTKLEQADEIDWIETNKALAKEIIEMKKQAEQEPCIECGRPTMSAESKCDDCHSMDDTAPVRTKDLTDDEILKVWNTTTAPLVHCLRAVIAADRELNK